MAAVLFSTAWDRYRHHLLAERQRSRNTVATYRVAITEFEEHIRPKRWEKATKRDLARFLDRPRRLRDPDRQKVVYAAALPVVMPRSWKRACMPMRKVS